MGCINLLRGMTAGFKTTTRYIVFGIVLISSCVIYEDPYLYEIPQEPFFWDSCHMPYGTSPEYCEQFDTDNSQCCTWNVGYSCYEEWCVWYDDLDCEWEKQWWDCEDW